MTAFKAPSTTLLRAFLKPSSRTTCQLHTIAGFMPRHKYAKVTGLDKLHRQKKKDIRAERQATIDRAANLVTDSPPQASTQDPTILSQSIPFTMSRTLNQNMPIYETSKNGGNKHITQIRKLSGDLNAMAASLRTVLNLPQYHVNAKGKKQDTVTINRLTKHVIIRGWRGAEVKKWAEGLGF